MGYRGMGHMDNGVQGYGVHEQWGTGVWGTWAVGHRGQLCTWAMGHSGQLGTRALGTWTMGCRPSNVSECQKMSSYQKNVKCQKIEHLDYGGGLQKQ